MAKGQGGANLPAEYEDQHDPFHARFLAARRRVHRHRRDIHRHPETLRGARTSQIVATSCNRGHRGPSRAATTGVSATLKASGRARRHRAARRHGCAAPAGKNEFDYASVHANKMHACGHDGHTTMLLGAAKHLARAGFRRHRAFHLPAAEEGWAARG